MEQSNLMKRANEGNKLPFKAVKRLKTAVNLDKNALQHLNELRPGLQYTIEKQEGPSHDPTFVISVKLDHNNFIGKGRSKQQAKHAAAEAALKHLLNLNTDTTKSIFNENTPTLLEKESYEKKSSGQPKNMTRSITEAEKKNPVMLLNELYPGLSYRVTNFNEKSQNQRFFITIEIDGNKYNGAGQNKKAAKAAAARAVLSKKYGVNFSSYINDSEKVFFDVPLDFADNVAKLVHEKIDNFTKKKKICDWSVVSGIVMTKDLVMKDAQLICIATGSNIIDSENLSFNGAALNDCHAEVIGRRCFKDFLFTQLELHFQNRGHQSIFEKVDDKFNLKSNIKFHFYISSIPCGDVTRFSNTESSVGGLNSNSSNHSSGMLYAKSKSGTVLVGSVFGDQKTNDILQKKSQYHIMSCSDKIALWNVLGIQGSLLNYFIEPIYFSTIVIGQPFHSNHMLFCLFKRIELSLSNLPSRFVLHGPKLASTSDLMAKSISEFPKVSLNWTCGQEKPELIIGSTGKPEKSPVSRLAKRSFFQRFSKLLCQDSSSPTVPRWYQKIKKNSPYYSQAKNVVIQALLSKDFGQWITKPDEQDVFDIIF